MVRNTPKRISRRRVRYRARRHIRRKRLCLLGRRRWRSHSASRTHGHLSARRQIRLRCHRRRLCHLTRVGAGCERRARCRLVRRVWISTNCCRLLARSYILGVHLCSRHRARGGVGRVRICLGSPARGRSIVDIGHWRKQEIVQWVNVCDLETMALSSDAILGDVTTWIYA